MTTRLSICIATLNRAAYLRETLRGLARQVTSAVEVVVLDGGSTDDTSAAIDEYRSQLPKLAYYRQSQPGGVDRDFDRAVAMASGEYCWLMSDDDALRPGAIDAVLARLAGEPLSVLVVNAAICNEDVTVVLRERFLEVDSDRVYGTGEGERFFVETGNYLSFIGGVVVRRALWMSRAREPYFGTLFVHVGVLFQSPLPDPAVVIAAPLVAIRYGNAQWSARSFEIWVFKWPELIWSFEQFNDTAKEMVCRRFPFVRPKTLLLYRAKAAYSMGEYRRWLASRIQSPVRRWVSIAIACIPVTVANIAVSLGVRALSGDPGVPLVDLRNSRYASFRTLQTLLRRMGARTGRTEAKR